jgi:hypothetical protein
MISTPVTVAFGDKIELAAGRSKGWRSSRTRQIFDWRQRAA